MAVVDCPFQVWKAPILPWQRHDFFGCWWIGRAAQFLWPRCEINSKVNRHVNKEDYSQRQSLSWSNVVGLKKKKKTVGYSWEALAVSGWRGAEIRVGVGWLLYRQPLEEPTWLRGKRQQAIEIEKKGVSSKALWCIRFNFCCCYF